MQDYFSAEFTDENTENLSIINGRDLDFVNQNQQKFKEFNWLFVISVIIYNHMKIYYFKIFN